MRRILVPLMISTAAPPRGKLLSLGGRTMGTTWSVRMMAENAQPSEQLTAGIQGELDSIVDEMSHWQADSCLGRFNSSAPGEWHALPQDFFTVLSYALDVAIESNGAYDPAAGGCVNLWGFGPVNRHDGPGFTLPSPAAAEAVRAAGGWRRIELDRTGRRARRHGNALLDLSAVAKGFGVDKVASYLDRLGVRDYLVEVGGELRGAGLKPDGLPWWVILESPGHHHGAGQPGEVLVALHGLSVATSGDYRRCFERDGRFFSHTIDPRTGSPLNNRVASVTVVHHQCMAADALSTALTVLGPEEGICFAEAHCLAARFLVREKDGFVEHCTSGFKEMLQ